MKAAINLSDFLKKAYIKSLHGVPMGKVQRIFLHVVLSSDEHAILISGQAEDVANRTEAFFLTEEPFSPVGWPTVIKADSAWQAEDLTAVWMASSLISSPRTVKFYSDPRDRERGLVPMGPMDSAAAVAFSSPSSNADQILLLYATPDYPCSVELAISAERCNEILANLEEFVPASVYTTVMGQYVVDPEGALGSI